MLLIKTQIPYSFIRVVAVYSPSYSLPRRILANTKRGSQFPDSCRMAVSHFEAYTEIASNGNLSAELFLHQALTI